MRIAFVSNVVYPYVTGGAEKRIYEIGRRLAREGHDVTVYGRHYWDGPRETTLEGMTLRAVSDRRDLYTDDRRSIPEAIEFAIDTLRPLRRNHDEHDAFVASTFPYFPVFSAALARLRTDTPLITTWHEVWLDYWNDYLGRLAFGGKTVERLTAAVPQHPIAVSENTADRLARIGPSRKSISVVPNGIDYDFVRGVDPAEPGYDVLFVGRLIEDKRVNLLLRAFDRVAPEYDLTLGVIGDGPEADRLTRLAQSLDASDRIDFLGFVEDHDDVLAQMQAARVFASPSTREGFGITAVEAMAAGCTVVAADHPESAVDEVIGDAGLLVDPTTEGVRAGLERALSGYQPATEPVDRARRFDWDTVAKEALDRYGDAIDG
ncbi:glycosyltransferase family 4 protein [Halomicroarcula sp. GCM10025709]|uniref:glycosyltransferase family 4 protein n=1 Tax=Haloarcula TaxID=2237 RepID=UPI0024C27784|nr:glycosyltransferase family 4 protein [Halomicroarcula sp. YJ-61-S]